MLTYMPLEEWKSSVISEKEVPEDVFLWKDLEDAEIKVSGDLIAKRQVALTLSTGSVDRDNDTIDPAGWDITNYRKNPIVLFAHRFMDLPIGVAVKIRKEDGKLTAIDQFVERDVYELADTVFQLITHDPPILRASSVGFRRKAHVFNEDRRGFDFLKQELLEHSIVPVPSNPDALIQARSAFGKDIMSPYVKWCEKALDMWHDEDGLWVPRTKLEDSYFAAGEKRTFSLPPASTVADRVKEDTDSRSMNENDNAPDESFSHHWDEAQEAKYVPPDVSRSTAEEGTSWTRPSLSDFTDESFDELSSAQKRRIAGHFAYATQNPPQAFGGLKLPHHQASNGQVVWAGVRAAMAALLGARGGVDIPDNERRGVYNHLVRHYEQFEKEPPEFRFVEGEVLKNMPEIFTFDEETGALCYAEHNAEEKKSDDKFDINILFQEDGHDNHHKSPESEELFEDDIRAIAKEELAEAVKEAFRLERMAVTGRLD